MFFGKLFQGNPKQDTLLILGGDMIPLKLIADGDCIAAPEDLQAWESDFSQQFIDRKTGRFVQVISDLNKKPIRVFKDRPSIKGRATDVISSRKQDEELAFLNTHKEKNRALTWVGIIAVLFALVISIVVLVQLRKGNESAAIINTLPLTLAMATAVTLGTRKRPVLDSVEDISKHFEIEVAECLCIVIDENTGFGGPVMLNRSLIPDLSLERRFKGIPCHLLGLDLKGQLWAIEPSNEYIVNESPQDLYIALDYEREVSEFYGLPEGAIEKIKFGVFITLIVIELIVLFLVITAATGG